MDTFTLTATKEGSAVKNDFNGDGMADILFRHTTTGKKLIYFQNTDGSRASFAYTATISNAWEAQ